MPASAERVAALRAALPRVFELRDSTPSSSPDDFFWQFEASALHIPAKRAAFEKLERQLMALDTDAWKDLRSRAVRELQKRRPGRGWQPLFDVLNEAKGFIYLTRLGCRDVRFVPRTTNKTPDLRADLNDRVVLCEVKTVNISENEASHRQRVSNGHMEAREVQPGAEGMLEKVSTTLETARSQLAAYDTVGDARRLILLIVHFDDWVGDYQEEYLAQIDNHLAQRPVLGVELVVSPASNLFARRFTMKMATVWEP